MTKKILEQYSDALSRTIILRNSVKKLENKLTDMNEQGYYVTDSVTRGKKGKKPLGTVIIAGFPHEKYQRISQIFEKRKQNLLNEEQILLTLTSEVEEYISKIEDVKIRNIFSLYYIENLTWTQVAHKMNMTYKNKKYSESSCRQRHDRFLEKNL